jgi:hypothetical protein
MKNILKAILASFLIAFAACAQTPVFTTVCASGDHVFAGVKIVREGWENSSYILRVSLDKLKSDRIMLPEEIANREIVELFPAEGNSLVVMSQWTLEQGDNPRFHRYDSKSKKWKKIGEIDCTTYRRLKVESNAVTFLCTEFDAEGREIEAQKKAVLKGVKLLNVGEFDVPVASVKIGSIRAELVGEEFKWKELKVRLPGKERVFRP